MIWLAWKLLTLPIRLAFGTVTWSFRLVRFVGIGRLVAFGAGVGVGYATAPTTGAEFRAKLAAAQQTAAATGGDVAAVVRFELANSPRTWQLPQPTVSVHDGRVSLRGTVARAEDRDALVRTAGAVPGVRAVDDELVVDADGTA